MNVLINCQLLYDYFMTGQFLDNVVNVFTKAMFDNALDGEDSERDLAAVAFDPTNLLYPIGFADQFFFRHMNTGVFVNRHLMPHYDVEIRREFKTSSSFSVDCMACKGNTSTLHPYTIVATAQKSTTIPQLLVEFRKLRFPLTCPKCGNTKAAWLNDFVHLPRYMLLRTRSDVNTVHPVVHFEDRFKAVGHTWQYVAASRIRPRTTLHRAHATALLFDRTQQKHFEIDGPRSVIVEAPTNINEHRFTVFERL